MRKSPLYFKKLYVSLIAFFGDLNSDRAPNDDTISNDSF